MPIPDQPPARTGRAVFISYAHADNQGADPSKCWLNRLLQHLQPLAFEDLITVATDRDIQPGDDWHVKIRADLDRAAAAVLLVSPAFLASEYIRNSELPVLLHRAKTQGLPIVPLILRPCRFQQTRFKYPDPKTGPEEFALGSLQAAGSPARALNEMTEGEQDRTLAGVAETLERWLLEPDAAPSECSPTVADELPEALTDFRTRLVEAAGGIPDLDDTGRQAILRHAPATIAQYRLARIAEWSQPRYQLDRRFTRLTLLLDQGAEAQGNRWQAQPKSFDDLRQVLQESDASALVLLGPPGCGKSTLLRRLELDLAADALRDPGGKFPLSLFLPLSRYRPARQGEEPPPPRDWLVQEWSRCHPGLPPLAELLRRGPFLLLLDAVNEIAHAGDADYRARVGLWRDFLGELPRIFPAVRAILSCRSLDYSASLSTAENPVPHVRIEALDDGQVAAFLSAYDAARGPTLWQTLRGTPQLDLFRSPFYLKLLLAQADADGRPPTGRAALFTGFIRQALGREIEAGHPLFRPGALLSEWDHGQVVRREWSDDYDLPAEGPLFPALAGFARTLQERHGAAAGSARGSRVRVRRAEALSLLGRDRGPDLLEGAHALQLLDLAGNDVLFVHQLFQEYFAARAMAESPQPALALSPWRAGEITPSLADTLAELADSDPLPEAPATGWEESFALAAAMAADPAGFVAALETVNLPLAGRCAAQADVAIPPAQGRRIRQTLIARSRDPEADLRARIAAARALGDLGDPRWERRRGPDGDDYLLPPLVAIAAGDYPIGSDEGLYDDEAPAHGVTVAAFAIGRFPVTNAEWQCFLEAGGYEDERWWNGEAGKRWRRGEDTAEGAKQQRREFRQRLQENPEAIRQMLEQNRITSWQAEDWEAIRSMTDADFEKLLEDWFPPGRQTRPAYWNDPAYNQPCQPVVGICWHEARAYAAWLSAQSGKTFRLPAEAEWEAAARGLEGRRYPWGGEFGPGRCNAFETHVRGTTPVGVFPGGDSPEGVCDLAGNVWEWTGNVYRPYPYLPDDGREDPEDATARRVLRGGSWSGDQTGARCACRLHGTPDNRSDGFGFRLVSVSPIR